MRIIQEEEKSENFDNGLLVIKDRLKSKKLKLWN